MERLTKRLKAIAKSIWTHRVSYGGLAIAYGCGCAGWIDKETVNQIVTGLYVAMVAQRH